MKQKILTVAGLLGLGLSAVQSQTVVPLNSWENSTEGWSIIETNTWTSNGFSTTKGVTQGSYSWQLTTTAVDYGPTLRGPSSTNVTWLMANAASLSMDILLSTNAPAFAWGIQIDLEVNQPGGAGTISVDGYNYPGDVYGNYNQNTISWTVSQATRTALDAYPNLPCYLTLSVGGGAGGTIYIDNLQLTKIPQVQGSLWVRELWDDLSSEEIPANTTVGDDPSSTGFASVPWVVNPAETNNCKLMAFRPGFPNDPTASAVSMGLPGTLDGTFGAMIQENNGFNFLPGTNNPSSFWTSGDFMTRQLTPGGFINFQAAGEYWFAMSIANSTASLDAQYVTFPSSGWGGIGFADGSTTNSDFVAVGVTGLNVYFGPTNVGNPWGETNASKAVYISQGTLGQSGNLNSTLYNPLLDLSASPPDQPPNYAPPYNSEYTQTNFTGGPYHINAFGSQTVGSVAGDSIVVLGHLKTFGNGTASLDAKYYTRIGGNSWNTSLDTSPTNITWDCSYTFNFGGTMTEMLIFENGQFPFYMFGFRASTNFNEVVGLDPGRIIVAPYANTYAGFAINMTNLAAEASSYSFASPPAGYGTLTYQWYQNGAPISGAIQQYLNIAVASTNDPSMPAGTDAGTYTCVATDPSGTWGSVTNSVVITVTKLNPPVVTGVQLLHDGATFLISFSEPSLTGVDDISHYVFNNGIVVTNLSVINSSTNTAVQLSTTPLPFGTKITLSITGITNVVGGTLSSTNESLWTDLVQTGVANWDAWLYPKLSSQSDYFNSFVPANLYPNILQSMSITSWDGPSGGVTIRGTDNYVGDGFGDRLYGWFIPPVTTNYVFYISCDDGGRLSLSTNESPTNLCVIACESLWAGPDEWTNVCYQYPPSPHRGDGTASAAVGTGYIWDNSTAAMSPATACEQNRSDQFIVAYWDSSGLTGQPGEPAGANDQANWANQNTVSPVGACIPSGMTNFWPNVDANGQALIKLQAGKMYYMQLEHVQIGGGYNMDVTYKIAGNPDPSSGVPGTTSGSPSALTGAAIAGTVPFAPTISIIETNTGPVINYTGVLLAGKSVTGITNVVAQSSGSTAISLGGPSQYRPAAGSTQMFYRTSE
jgi:hypothetical protein